MAIDGVGGDDSENGERLLEFGEIEDDFSLHKRTFRVKAEERNEGEALIVELGSRQVILETGRGKNVLVRQAPFLTIGERLLRVVFALVSFVFFGFVFAASVAVLLHLFLGIVTDIEDAEEANTFGAKAFGAILSVPVFVYALSSAVTLAAGLVLDAWDGFLFLELIGWWPRLINEWFSILVVFFVPVLAMSIALLVQDDDWWRIGLLALFSGTAGVYLVYASAVLFYEVQASIFIVAHNDSVSSLASVLEKMIMIRMVHLLSIYRYESTDAVNREDGSESFCCGHFFKVNPKRIWWVESPSYATESTWSLASFCCNSSSRKIMQARGRNKISSSLWIGSLVCFTMSAFSAILLIAGLAVYFGISTMGIVLASILFILYMIPHLFWISKLMAYRKRLHSKDNVISLERKMWRIWEPSVGLVWTLLGFGGVLLFLIPAVVLFVLQNTLVAVLFLVLSFAAIVRFFFDPHVLLKEYGIPSRHIVSDEPENRMRLHLIMNRLSQRGVRNFVVIIFLAFTVLAIFLLASTNYAEDSSGEASDWEDIVLLPDFEFPQDLTELDLLYPTCRANGRPSLGLDRGDPELFLVDAAFLAQLAYFPGEKIQPQLDLWFGPGVAVLNASVSNNFLETSANSRISLNVITFPATGIDVIAVRGTVTAWDVFTDMQLWLSTILFQMTRAILPLGSFWTPILPDLIAMVDAIEADNIAQVSYYRDLTDFVLRLKDERPEGRFILTGHSLAGGLAMISGAQTETLAIAVSGINNVLSRRTFTPPLSIDAIERFNFNIIPQSDPIPKVDDTSLLSQNIKCRAPQGTLLGCHSSRRTVCELLFQCGGRPILCECITKYGYPEPIANGSRTFSEACGQR